MTLKVYADRLSQPSRAVLTFCKINGIDFEEIRIDVLKNNQFSPEYKAINPVSLVPAIVDGRFKLFESHTILMYLACAYPGVADHWINERFLLGSSQPSIADLSLVCEIMQLELLSEKDYHRILSPCKKVLKWIEDTKSATRPHFDEIHGILFETQERVREWLAM